MRVFRSEPRFRRRIPSGPLRGLAICSRRTTTLHIGKTSIVDEAMAQVGYHFSNFMQRLRPDVRLRPRFAWYFLNTPVAREQLGFHSNTTTGIVEDRLQGIVETNFKLYRRVADDEAFAQVLVDWLYERFRKEAAE